MAEKDIINNIGQELMELTSGFCEKYLNEEHKELTGRIIHRLVENKFLLFHKNNLKGWAAAVIHAIGSLNYLFDSSFKPYITEDILNTYFGTAQYRTLEKSREIKNLLKLDVFERENSGTEIFKGKSLTDLVKVDEFFVTFDSFLPDLFEQSGKADYQNRDTGPLPKKD